MNALTNEPTSQESTPPPTADGELRKVAKIAQALNDSLTSIRGFASLALSNLEDGVACPDHLQQITDAANDGANLARDLLRMSEAPAAGAPETPVPLAAAPAASEPAESLEEPAEEQKPAPAKAAKSSDKETILVVEDEEMVRDLVVRSLGYLGYNVIDASNGEEGLDMGRDRHEEIDMVFTDIVMPRMSGPEMVARMVDEELQFPVLYTTGFTDNKRLLDNGEIRDGVNLLPKPYTTKVLASRIREVLDGIVS